MNNKIIERHSGIKAYASGSVTGDVRVVKNHDFILSPHQSNNLRFQKLLGKPSLGKKLSMNIRHNIHHFLSPIPHRTTAHAFEIPFESVGIAPLWSAFGVAVIIFLSYRLIVYSQLEVIRAAMLARHVKQSDAKVLQLGGTTRDIFYYPKRTMQVVVISDAEPKGIWENAGIQSSIPVIFADSSIENFVALSNENSFDSLVLFQPFANLSNPKYIMNCFWKILKPGGCLIFIQKIGGIGAPQLAANGKSSNSSIIDFLQESRWDFIQWDTALPYLEPHIVGICIKPLNFQSRSEESNSSVDIETFRQLKKRKQ